MTLRRLVRAWRQRFESECADDIRGAACDELLSPATQRTCGIVELVFDASVRGRHQPLAVRLGELVRLLQLSAAVQHAHPLFAMLLQPTEACCVQSRCSLCDDWDRQLTLRIQFMRDDFEYTPHQTEAVLVHQALFEWDVTLASAEYRAIVGALGDLIAIPRTLPPPLKIELETHRLILGGDELGTFWGDLAQLMRKTLEPETLTLGIRLTRVSLSLVCVDAADDRESKLLQEIIEMGVPTELRSLQLFELECEWLQHQRWSWLFGPPPASPVSERPTCGASPDAAAAAAPGSSATSWLVGLDINFRWFRPDRESISDFITEQDSALEGFHEVSIPNDNSRCGMGLEALLRRHPHLERLALRSPFRSWVDDSDRRRRAEAIGRRLFSSSSTMTRLQELVLQCREITDDDLRHLHDGAGGELRCAVPTLCLLASDSHIPTVLEWFRSGLRRLELSVVYQSQVSGLVVLALLRSFPLLKALSVRRLGECSITELETVANAQAPVPSQLETLVIRGLGQWYEHSAVTAFLRLALEHVGSTLKTLCLNEGLPTRTPTVDYVRMILSACPGLCELRFSHWDIPSLRLLVDAYERGQCDTLTSLDLRSVCLRRSELRAELFAILADPTRRITAIVRDLTLSVANLEHRGEHFPNDDEDEDNAVDDINSDELEENEEALITMLQGNNRLVHATVQRPMADWSRTDESKALDVAILPARPLPRDVVMAILSTLPPILPQDIARTILTMCARPRLRGIRAVRVEDLIL